MIDAPPFSITSKMFQLVEQIGEAIGERTARPQSDTLSLRRVNRIRTLRGSLAIEGNTLSEDEIATILEGKTVVAPPREIQEVRNAIVAYDAFPTWNPSKREDLLAAHGMMMSGLIDAPGEFRRTGAGVMGPGGAVIHVAPPAKLVPSLIANLQAWLSETDTHALIASAVFHYEFEFIHPFVDGNGRMGRLWQTCILAKWKPLFASVPVESMIYERQDEYYAVLRECGFAGNSTKFIEFMLQAIVDTLAQSEVSTDPVSDPLTDPVSDPLTDPVAVPENEYVAKLLKVLKRGPKSGKAIMEKLGLQHKPSFRKRYLRPALDAGLIEMTNPDSPNATNQRYRLTQKVRA